MIGVCFDVRGSGRHGMVVAVSVYRPRVAFPTAVMAVTATAMMKPAITAYSTEVGPSSLRRNCRTLLANPCIGQSPGDRGGRGDGRVALLERPEPGSRLPGWRGSNGELRDLPPELLHLRPNSPVGTHSSGSAELSGKPAWSDANDHLLPSTSPTRTISTVTSVAFCFSSKMRSSSFATICSNSSTSFALFPCSCFRNRKRYVTFCGRQR